MVEDYGGGVVYNPGGYQAGLPGPPGVVFGGSDFKFFVGIF